MILYSSMSLPHQTTLYMDRMVFLLSFSFNIHMSIYKENLPLPLAAECETFSRYFIQSNSCRER